MRRFELISKEQYLKDIVNLEYYHTYKPEYYTYMDAYDHIKLPQRATSKSAGYDLYSPVRFTIMPYEQIMVPTGLKVNMEDDDVLLIIIRSSLGIKKGLSIPNQTGVIDADYYNNVDNEGHIWVSLKNNTNRECSFDIGDRIAQGIFIKYNKVDDDEPISDSRNGGIGSTK